MLDTTMVAVTTTEPPLNSRCTSLGCTTSPVTVLVYEAMSVLIAVWLMASMFSYGTVKMNRTLASIFCPGESGGIGGGDAEPVGGGDGGGATRVRVVSSFFEAATTRAAVAMPSATMARTTGARVVNLPLCALDGCTLMSAPSLSVRVCVLSTCWYIGFDTRGRLTRVLKLHVPDMAYRSLLEAHVYNAYLSRIHAVVACAARRKISSITVAFLTASFRGKSQMQHASFQNTKWMFSGRPGEGLQIWSRFT